jgi:type III pantothenate kinase
MILCLDCGNSRLKWGLRDGSDWRISGALLNGDIAQLATQLPKDCVPQAVIGCNVAGSERASQTEVQIESALNRKVEWITVTTEQCGVTNGYENPATLGADRWAALIAARALHQGAVLVVLAGTATTIDVLDKEGCHLGGLILPGVTLMARALAAGTAQLPQASGYYKQWPRNTHDAIVSGAIQATLGAVQRMAALLPAPQDAVCILSGGAAEVLQAHLDILCRRIDTLVLDGLVCIAATRRFDPA